MMPIADPCANLTTGYLLVDVCAFSDINYEGIRRVACIPSLLTKAEELMPCLISVSELSLPQLEQITEIFRGQTAGDHSFAICAWLDSDLEIGELAEHLARFLCGPGPNETKVLWRFFDPRAFATSMLVFSQVQCRALLGPIKSWKFTWCRNWWQVSQNNFEQNPLSDCQAGWPTTEQWPVLRGARMINNVINRFCDGRTPLPEESLQYLTKGIIHLVDGLQLQLHDEDDLSEFVFLCVKYGSSYRRHPKLAQAWAVLTQEKISWTDVRSKLLPADFERLNIAIYS